MRNAEGAKRSYVRLAKSLLVNLPLPSLDLRLK